MPAPAPGAGEVETVQMRDLAVAPVGYEGGGEQARRTPLPDPRQEAGQPLGEGGCIENPPHQQRLHQRRREELVAALAPSRGSPVALIVIRCPRADQSRQFTVVGVRPF
jgi:hypothetical protein